MGEPDAREFAKSAKKCVFHPKREMSGKSPKITKIVNHPSLAILRKMAQGTIDFYCKNKAF